MEDVFKNYPKVNIFMIVLSILAIISFLVVGNWQASIWALNTAIWCGLQGTDESTIKDLRDQISDLLTEKYRK